MWGKWGIGEWIADPKDDTLTRNAESVKIEPRHDAPTATPCRIARRRCESGATAHGGGLDGRGRRSGFPVYQSVSQLRKVLGDTDFPASYIETVARKGYRLVAPVHRPEEAAGQPQPAHRAVPATPRRLRWIGGVAAALIVIAAGIFVSTRKSSEVSVTSIAVMPFVDMSAGKTEQPFCDGVTEELSNWLTQIPTLRVVARRSASAFRDKQIDVREIGRLLGTANVLEGSLRRSGSLLKVSVQLIATKDGYSVWSGTYESPLIDVIRLQEQVARQVASSLELRLTDATSKKFADEAKRKWPELTRSI